MPIESRHSWKTRLRIQAEGAIDEAFLAARKYEPWEDWDKARSVLLAEVYELTAELDRAVAEGVSPENLRTEALQVASIALRIAAIAKAEDWKRRAEGL